MFYALRKHCGIAPKLWKLVKTPDCANKWQNYANQHGLNLPSGTLGLFD